MSAEMRSDSTIGIASPARWAATSSSVKNGLPCPRARTSSTRAGAAGPPSRSGDPAVTSSRSRPARWSRCAPGSRVSSASRRSMRGVGGGLVRSVGADQDDPFIDEVPGQELEQVPRRVVGPVEVLDADDHRTVGRRACPTSSSTVTNRPPRPRDRRCFQWRRVPRRPSGRAGRHLRARPASTDVPGGAGRRAGRAGSGPRRRARNGRGTAAPAERRAPSATSVDLPIPASPLTSSTEGRPSRASSTAAVVDVELRAPADEGLVRRACPPRRPVSPVASSRALVGRQGSTDLRVGPQCGSRSLTQRVIPDRTTTPGPPPAREQPS